LRERIPATRESFFAGNAIRLLDSGWGKMGLSIYIELIYPNLIADEVRRGASLLVNVSNLAWFHDSSINRQLLAAAVLRAVENERYFVLATNTGISAIIEPTGLIASESLPGERGVLLDTIQFLYRKTPFSKMWWL
jgi:apolipoprotein N-acyltransferase